MHKNTVYNWVKNVYSLCIDYGDRCVRVFTPLLASRGTYSEMGVKPQVFTHFLASFTPYSYTGFFRQSPLLISHLFTLSTPPITIKTKEK